MDPELLRQLIDKYLANQCSEEETRQLNEWYRQFDEKPDYLSMLSREKQEELKNRIFSGIESRLNNAAEAAAQPAYSDRPAVAMDVARKPPLRRSILLARIAAVASLVLIVSLLTVHFWPQRIKQYETAYGERNIISLPDGSRVVLNGHSTLRSNSNWSTAAAREVWLDGEAFFSVTHMKNHQKFLVHTADGLTIEVLGTSFNVKKRGAETQVVLKEGKIRLSIPGPAGTDTLTMKPGDLVEVNAGTAQRIRAVVQPEQYTSWQNPRMIFSGTPLKEILRMIQEVYGYDVVVTDPTLMEKQFTGAVPNDNIDVLLQALRESLPCSITLKDNRLLISTN